MGTVRVRAPSRLSGQGRTLQGAAVARVNFEGVSKAFDGAAGRRRPPPRRRTTASCWSSSARRAAARRRRSGSSPDSRIRRRARCRSATSVVNDVEPKDRDIAMVFQSYALYPHMTLRRNIEFPLRQQRVPARRAGPPRRGGGRHARPRRPARPEARPALRRPAPAGGPGPGHRPRPPGLPHGRAALEPRRHPAHPDPGRHRVAPAAARHDDHLRDPRPGRGHDHGPPHRRHATTAGSSRWPPPQDLYERPANTFVAVFLGQPGHEPDAGRGWTGRTVIVDGTPDRTAWAAPPRRVRTGHRRRAPRGRLAGLRGDIPASVVLVEAARRRDPRDLRAAPTATRVVVRQEHRAGPARPRRVRRHRGRSRCSCTSSTPTPGARLELGR